MCLTLVCVSVSVEGQAAEEDPFAQWSRLQVGDTVPPFSYTPLAGVQQSTDQLKGRVIHQLVCDLVRTLHDRDAALGGSL